jgi:hypothetical protein
MSDLRRILKPGGYLLITTHGEFWLKALSEEEKARYLSGQLVVRNGEESGRNECAVYHPVGYVRERLAKGFRIVDYMPEGATGTGMQDIHLFRKE